MRHTDPIQAQREGGAKRRDETPATDAGHSVILHHSFHTAIAVEREGSDGGCGSPEGKGYWRACRQSHMHGHFMFQVPCTCILEGETTLTGVIGIPVRPPVVFWSGSGGISVQRNVHQSRGLAQNSLFGRIHLFLFCVHIDGRMVGRAPTRRDCFCCCRK